MKARNLVVTGAALAGATLVARAAFRRTRRMSFQDKVILVTGARGLGLAIARRFADAGARVVVCARDEAEVRAAERDLTARGASALGIACDLTEPAQIGELLAAIDDRFGAVDVLVNNAGAIQVGPAEHMTHADFDAAMRIHFWAPLELAHAVLPEMRRRRAGRIVNIASIGGKLAAPHLLPYSASKFALVGWSEGLRAEVARDGVFVTTVCPGLMRTGSTRNARFKGKNEAEHAWFAALASMPGVSIDADRAAARVVRACRDGVAEIMVSTPARIASTLHGVFPGATAEVSALIERVLPGAGGIGSDDASGAESGPSTDERAAVKFHEVH